MRRLFVLAALAVPAVSFANPPSQQVSGQVTDYRGIGAKSAIVAAKATASPAPSSALADPDHSAAADVYGRYSLRALAGKTYNMAAVQVQTDGSQVLGITLPQPTRAAVVASPQDDIQALSVGRPAPVLNAATAVQSPVSTALLALDNSLSTAWQTDPAQPIGQQYVALDLGSRAWLAEAVIVWQGAAPLSYRLQASNDPAAMTGGGTWSDVYVTTAGKAVPLPGATGSNVSVIVPASPSASRYLRVLVDAYAVGQTTTSIADIYAVPAPAITGTVTDAAGSPVAGAAVGGFLDNGPYVLTGADGRYSLPAPMETAVVGAHDTGSFVSGPRWLDNNQAPLTADFTLFPAGASVLDHKLPTITPSVASGNDMSLTDGVQANVWVSGRSEVITPASPTRITWTLDNATVTEVDVQWSNFPAGWHLEMTNNITYNNGTFPQPTTRTYYTQGEAAGSADEAGGYELQSADVRHVTAIKLAPVSGVTSLSIVITKTNNADPIAIHEVSALSPRPTDIADAVSALRISSGLQTAPADPNALWRWNADNSNNRIDLRDAVQLLQDLTNEVKPLRVLVINYQPYIEQAYTFNNTAYAGVKLRNITGWNDPYPNTAGFVSDMQQGTHGMLRFCVLPQIEVDEYSIYQDGFRYTDATFLADWQAGGKYHTSHCDENAIIKEFDLVRRVDCGDVDEVLVQSFPGMGMWETTMAGPNAYFCNSGPVSGTNGTRLFVMTFFNYERGNEEMLEDWGHRTESILGWKVYGGWNSASERTMWDLFTRYDKITPGRASCGNVHYPPNGIGDYDWGNTTLVSSDADDWLNYPNFTGSRTMVSRQNWAGPYAGDWGRNYLRWWYQHLPHAPGLGPDGKQANWYKYAWDMNAYPESR